MRIVAETRIISLTENLLPVVDVCFVDSMC